MFCYIIEDDIIPKSDEKNSTNIIPLKQINQLIYCFLVETSIPVIALFLLFFYMNLKFKFDLLMFQNYFFLLDHLQTIVFWFQV